MPSPGRDGGGRKDSDPSAATSAHMNRLKARRRPGLQAEVTQRGAEIVGAIGVAVGGAILESVHFTRAGRVEKVVAADLVGGDGQHRIAEVRPEHVAGGQEDLALIVEGAAIGEPLAAIRRQSKQVAGLATDRIDHAQPLATLQHQADAARSRDHLPFDHRHLRGAA